MRPCCSAWDKATHMPNAARPEKPRRTNGFFLLRDCATAALAHRSCTMPCRLQCGTVGPVPVPRVAARPPYLYMETATRPGSRSAAPGPLSVQPKDQA